MILARGVPTADGPRDVGIAPGEIVLLDGPNGSGKTSLLRALAGLDAPVAPASVDVDGVDPRRAPARDVARGVRVAFQDARDGLAGLTVRGEFTLRDRALADHLAPLRDRDVATLSSGEARRVALALADDARAPLLLLDEPAEGLDHEGRDRLARLVAAHRARGGAVVAVDHSGALAGLATRTVTLGPASAPSAPVAPSAPAGPVVVESPPAVVSRDVRAVRVPGVRLAPGFHALSGPNGSGKSTALLRLAGMIGDGREVRVAGAPPRAGRNVRALPARARDLLMAESVNDELAGVDAGVRELLVPPHLDARHPLTLSGGEAQRVALALVLGTPAPLVLLDEPEAHLDADGRAALVHAISKRVGEGACVLAATHDPMMLALASTVMTMEGGT